MTPDPRTAPDRLRALFAEHDPVDADQLYDELVADPRMVMDVLRCIGYVRDQWWHCAECGETARTRDGIQHGPHWSGALTVTLRWSGGTS